MNEKSLTLAEAIAYANSHDGEVPEQLHAELFQLLGAPPKYDNCPVTRSVCAVLASKRRDTLAVMASNGDYSLPFYRSGRSVRYTLKAIKDYLQHTSEEVEA